MPSRYGRLLEEVLRYPERRNSHRVRGDGLSMALSSICGIVSLVADDFLKDLLSRKHEITYEGLRFLKCWRREVPWTQCGEEAVSDIGLCGDHLSDLRKADGEA